MLRRDAVYYDAARLKRPLRKAAHKASEVFSAMGEAVRTMLQAETAREALRGDEREADPGFLWDFWYPAARSSEIRAGKLQPAMLLEVPLVLGRTAAGKTFAMRDSCPHRGIPLSYGRIDGSVVECSYHGWRIDACSGQCVEIPSLTSKEK